MRGGCRGGGQGEEISQYNHSLGQLPQPVSLVMLGRLGLQANWSSVPLPDGSSPIDTPIQGTLTAKRGGGRVVPELHEAMCGILSPEVVISDEQRRPSAGKAKQHRAPPGPPPPKGACPKPSLVVPSPPPVPHRPECEGGSTAS